MTTPRIVSHAEWLEARKAHLAREKASPWERVDKDYHYSTYARGLDMLNGAYHLLDLTSKGRDEDGLSFSMSWVRRHDQY